MASLSVMVARIFKQAWNRYGRPTMSVVPPVDEWALPAGWAYDSTVDNISDTNGYILPNPEDYWVAETVYIVPTQRTADFDIMVAAGVVPTGGLDVYVLEGDSETVRVAHAVQVSGQWYDVLEVGEAPPGTTGLWARVRLRRRS